MADQSIKERLAEFLSDAGRRRFDWRTNNCCLFVASWIDDATGIDVTMGERGKFASYQAAKAEIDGAGGFLDYVAVRLDPHFARTGAPLAGDVGIIERLVPIAGNVVALPLGAICVECGKQKSPAALFAFRSPGGLTVAPSTFRAAWSVMARA